MATSDIIRWRDLCILHDDDDDDNDNDDEDDDNYNDDNLGLCIVKKYTLKLMWIFYS